MLSVMVMVSGIVAVAVMVRTVVMYGAGQVVMMVLRRMMTTMMTLMTMMMMMMVMYAGYTKSQRSRMSTQESRTNLWQ